MKKNLKKYYLSIFICLILLSSIVTLNKVKADSGWDYDYDSSSSWDSGSSSWDSGSSWSSDSYYSSGGDLGETNPLLVIITLAVIIIILIIASRNNGNKNKGTKGNTTSKVHTYKGMTDEEITKLDSTLNKATITEKSFEIYKNVQLAWMNFDDDALRKNLTDEIYNMYSSQLKTLKIKNQQNIMKDIDLKRIEIMSININNGIEEIQVYLQVSQFDYVIDKDNKVLRGNDKYKNRVEYMITLVRHIDNQKVEKCPNCGAKIDIISGGVCPYCDSTIINNNEEFIMSKKECIGQWQER